MFGSTILEVAIGVIFIYLLLSLICTAINEFISLTLNKRGENLFEGIKNLLNDPTFTGLAQRIYNHGLVDGISQASKNPKKPSRRPSYIASKTFALALLDILNSQSAGQTWKSIAEERKLVFTEAKAKLDMNPKDAKLQNTFQNAQSALAQAEKILAGVDAVKQAYDEAECAAVRVNSPKDVKNLKTAKEKLEKALGLGRMIAVELPDQLENIQRAVLSLPDGHTKQSLLVLIDKTKRDTLTTVSDVLAAGQPLQILEENIEQWFNDAMDRVGGWYKRWTQRILLVISAVLVLAGNIDTLMLAERFSRDNALRSSIVAAAANAVQGDAADPTQSSTARENLLREAENLSLPIGWVANRDDPYRDEQVPSCTDVPLSDCIFNWGLKLLGLFISIIAIQLGAPFWFDTLSKFINIRSSGTPPGERTKSAPQTTKKEQPVTIVLPTPPAS